MRCESGKIGICNGLFIFRWKQQRLNIEKTLLIDKDNSSL